MRNNENVESFSADKGSMNSEVLEPTQNAADSLFSTVRNSLSQSQGQVDGNGETNSYESDLQKEYAKSCNDNESQHDSVFCSDLDKEEKPVPESVSIGNALFSLAGEENANLCRQLELLVRFDEIEGWRDHGAKNCAQWMNSYLQVDFRTAWERLRVGKKLADLPIIRNFFKNGKLGWSKIRILTRVANATNEEMLAHASLDSSVSDVQRICQEFRWNDDVPETSESLKAELQWKRRSLSWHQLADGSTQIRIVLPPERAANFLHAIEQCEEILYEESMANEIKNDSSHREDSQLNNNCIHESIIDSDITPSQRRADAAVLMAERSIAYNGEHASPADRYQVVMNIDVDSLSVHSNQTSSDDQVATEHGQSKRQSVPIRNPMIEGVGSVPVETARQVACDCSFTQLVSGNGEPISVGRKQRMWPASMRRAILTRDRHCQFPGCPSHRFLQIHHIHHWADGGVTSIENGVCLCQHHHQLIHTGKYKIERIGELATEGADDGGYRENKGRLLPTRCRFIVTTI